MILLLSHKCETKKQDCLLYIYEDETN